MDIFTFKPDVTHRKLVTMDPGSTIGFPTFAPPEEGGVPSLPVNDVTLRVKRVKILDFKEGWFDSQAEVYLVGIVNDALGKEPIRLEIKSFEGIKRGEPLNLGPSGLSLYINEMGVLPRFLDYRLLIVESDERVRQIGALMQEIISSDAYKAAKDALTAAAAGANPIAAVAIPMTDLVLQVVAKVLKANRDDQLLLVAGTFFNSIERLGVSYGPITDKNRNCIIEYQVEEGRG